MKRGEIDLVHVAWGPSDQGVVSLKSGKWLFYAWSSSFDGHHAAIPTVGIEDEDFRLIIKPNRDGELEPTWDDVPELLAYPEFPLMERLEFPEATPAAEKDGDPQFQDEAVVRCQFCGKDAPARTAHRHGNGWVGDECCWDERLRASE